MVARSRSASASTIIGSLPPSSRLTGVSVWAACAITFLPVRTEPVNITKSTSSISAAPVSPRPVATWKTSLGDPGLGEHLRHQQRGERRDLRRLHDHRVAGGQRRDAVAERVVERVVPGADHADHAERRVADDHPPAAHERRRRLDLLVGEVLGRLLGPELERRRGRRRARRTGSRRRAGRSRRTIVVDHPLGVGDHPAAGRQQDLGAALEARAPPSPAARRAPPRPSRGPRRPSARERSRSSHPWPGSRPGFPRSALPRCWSHLTWRESIPWADRGPGARSRGMSQATRSLGGAAEQGRHLRAQRGQAARSASTRTGRGARA